MTWKRAASTEDFEKKTGKEVNLDGNRIAIFRTNGKFYATEPARGQESRPFEADRKFK